MTGPEHLADGLSLVAWVVPASAPRYGSRESGAFRTDRRTPGAGRSNVMLLTRAKTGVPSTSARSFTASRVTRALKRPPPNPQSDLVPRSKVGSWDHDLLSVVIQARHAQRRILVGYPSTQHDTRLVKIVA